MQSATFVSRQCTVDDQACYRAEVAQFEEIRGDPEIPIKFLDLTLQISKACACAHQSFVGADDADVIPHEAADFIPVVINDNDFVDILSMAGAPLREIKGLMILRVLRLQQRLRASSGQNQRFEERVAGEPVCAVQTGAGYFADCKKSPHGGGPFQVGLYAAALIVRGRNDRDRLPGDVDPHADTGFINVRKSL